MKIRHSIIKKTGAQGALIARGELLLVPELFNETNSKRILGSKEEYENLIRQAISIKGKIDHDGIEAVVQKLAYLSEENLRQIWARWLESESVVLHVLISRVFAACSDPGDEIARWILATGIDYPDPSYNRHFVQAAIRHLGLCNVLQVLLAKAKGATADELQRIAAAYYWAYYDSKDLSGESPSSHDSNDETMLRKKLRKRLRKVAKYLRPWWVFW